MRQLKAIKVEDRYGSHYLVDQNEGFPNFMLEEDIVRLYGRRLLDVLDTDKEYIGPKYNDLHLNLSDERKTK